MFKEGVLAKRFPEKKMVVKNGTEGWVINKHFFPKAVIEKTILNGQFERLKMDNFLENLIK